MSLFRDLLVLDVALELTGQEKAARDLQRAVVRGIVVGVIFGLAALIWILSSIHLP